MTGHKVVFTEESLYIKGPDNHQCCRAGCHDIIETGKPDRPITIRKDHEGH